MGSFDSLRYRNFRLLWTGAALSNVGTWMQSVALSWYVFLLTHSAFWVSFVTFVNFVPTVLSPIGGVFTDRLDRKRILLVTQTLMMVDATVLAVLAALGRASLFAVLALTFGQGLAFALNGPTWQAFIPSLVPPEAMVNAIALNSAQFSLARVIGPAVGGALIVSAGPALVFGINAGSFLAVLVALTLVRVPPHEPSPNRPRVLEELASGLRYTWAERRIRTMIATVAVASFFGAPVTALLPVYASDVFGRGAAGFGVLAAAVGAGALIGALALGRIGSRVSPAEVAWSMIGMGAALVLFALVRVYGVGLALLTAYGAAYLFSVSGTNGDIQLHVKDAFRGRVLSLAGVRRLVSRGVAGGGDRRPGMGCSGDDVGWRHGLRGVGRRPGSVVVSSAVRRAGVGPGLTIAVPSRGDRRPATGWSSLVGGDGPTIRSAPAPTPAWRRRRAGARRP